VPGARSQDWDLVRYLPDGNIEFLGRIDHQVKAARLPHRTWEIEAVLSHHRCATDHCPSLEDIPGDKRLVAYVVLYQEHALTLRTAALLEGAATRVHGASALWLPEKLPTPNGKVDAHCLIRGA